jgi:hypothetical protein
MRRFVAGTPAKLTISWRSVLRLQVAKDIDNERKACEIRIRSERRVGRPLKEKGEANAGQLAGVILLALVSLEGQKKGNRLLLTLASPRINPLNGKS